MDDDTREEYGADFLNDEFHRKEREWKKAIKTALSGRDQQIASLKQQVTDFQKQLENTLQLLLSKERETAELENTIRDLQVSLENEKKENENSAKRLTDKFTERLQEKDAQTEKLKQVLLKEQTDMRERYAKAIHKLTREYKSQIESFENELQKATDIEKELRSEIEKSNCLLQEKSKQLQLNENKVIELHNELKELQVRLTESCNKETTLKQKIKDNEIIVQKLNEKNHELHNENRESKNEIIEKVNSINDLMKFELEKDNKIHDGISNVTDMLAHLHEENSSMKNILTKMSNDLIPQCESIGVQVNINLTDISFEDTIIILKKRISELTENEIKLSDELQKCQTLLENTLNQNLLLREVVKSMKRDKEELIKQRQMEDDEQRIRRLEDSIQILKVQMTKENCGDGIWVVLNEMKDDLKGLKGKSWHTVTKVNPVLQEVTNIPTSKNHSIPLSPTVISLPSSSSSHRNLPLQVPKVEENIIKNRHRRVSYAPPFSNNS